MRISDWSSDVCSSDLHRLRPRLDDVKLPGLAMLCPFHVHRATVMLLDQHRPAGQLENILVIKDEALPLGRARIDDPGAPAAAFGIAPLQRLAAPDIGRAYSRERGGG